MNIPMTMEQFMQIYVDNLPANILSEENKAFLLEQARKQDFFRSMGEKDPSKN